MYVRPTDHRSLPLFYHLNSEPWLNEEGYSQAYSVQYKELQNGGAALALPSITDEASLVLPLLRARRSCRKFTDRTLPLSVAARMLGGAYAPLRQSVLPSGLEIDSRGVPSAGGLFPLELYPLIHNIPGVEEGLYHYNAIAHQLEPLRVAARVADFSRSLLAQSFLEGANLVVFIAAVFERTLHKYGPRGYRYILLEAGHVAQSICLLAQEAGLASLCVGGYMDGDLNDALELETTEESVVYCVGVGHPGDSEA
jgi:SagB-type dehydrogenase family enzyme